MNSSICVYLFVAINCVVGQKYKALWINTSINLDEFGITSESNPLVFEFKGCSSASFIFRDYGNTWRYIVKLRTSLTGIVNVTVTTRFPTLVAVHEVYNHGKDCNTFVKMKIRWKDGIIAAWSYHVTGWNQLLILNDILPNIKSPRISTGNGFQWKIYILEHSTSPYRVTCINF